ncbi:MAG TPA: bifunctional oligoribonuclease/PAP phosphatase NrnA [Ktedonobacterales bacterium]
MSVNESALAERRERMAALLASEIDRARAEQAWNLIAQAQRIVLLAHEKPDPDALGSALGLAWALKPLGKRCVVACADPVPANYGFLPGHETVVTDLPDNDFDLVIALDAGELSRYGALYTRHQRFFDSALLLNMDHHVTSPGIGACSIIDVASAATAELLTIFLLNRGVAIGREAAICLLAGIITDTRSFEFDATTDRTLLAGAYLVAAGATPEDIIKPMYRLKPLAKERLWGHALQSLASAADGRIVWAAIRQRDLVAADATPDMDDGLPAFLMDTEGAALAALFRETPDGATRVSLRSAAPYDASAICAQFGGGGHVRASGCTLRMGIDEAQRVFIPALEAAIAGSAQGLA